jgi:hypothetical protein
MRFLKIISALCCAAAAACGGDEPGVDTEGCEHLEEGPFEAVTASAARDAAAPSVAPDHKAYTTTLPAGAVGYVAFPAAEATDYVVFLDKPVPFAVFNSTGGAVTLTASADSSPECATIRGRHTFALQVGTAFFGLGPNMGMPVNLVIEEAGGHEE